MMIDQIFEWVQVRAEKEVVGSRGPVEEHHVYFVSMAGGAEPRYARAFDWGKWGHLWMLMLLSRMGGYSIALSHSRDH